MSYGISITSGFDSIQIDSNTSLTYLKVITQGSAATLSNIPASRLVCIRPPQGGNDSGTSYGALKSGTGPFTYNFYKAGAEAPNTSIVDYVTLESTKISSPSPGYGLQVYNTEGELAFDSGIFINGTTANQVVSMVKVLPPGTAISGNTTSASSILYSGGDCLEIYAIINPSVYYGPNIAYNGFKWAADSTIRWNNYLIIQGFGVPPIFGSSLYTSLALLKIV